jgi:hypothetical protein
VSPSRNSRATLELIEALRREGIDFSPRKVERWSEEGPIPEASRVRQGRKGTSAILAPHTVEYVREGLDIQRRHRPLHHVNLIMFLRGREIADDKLRHAFRKRLAEEKKVIRSATQNAELMGAAEEIASSIVSSLSRNKDGRAMLARIEELQESKPDDEKESPEGIATSFFTNIFLLANNEEVDDEAIREIIESSDLASMEKAIAGLGPVVSRISENDIRSAACMAALPSKEAAIEECSLSDLRLAADLVRSLGLLATEFTLFSRRVGLGQEAFGYSALANRTEMQLVDEIPPVALQLQHPRWRKNANRRIDWMEVAIPQFKALNALLDELPRRYWKWATPGKEAWLEVVPDVEREKLRGILNAIYERRPELKVVKDQKVWDTMDELESKIEDIT